MFDCIGRKVNFEEEKTIPAIYYVVHSILNVSRL